jgi:hypothetical protein
VIAHAVVNISELRRTRHLLVTTTTVRLRRGGDQLSGRCLDCLRPVSRSIIFPLGGVHQPSLTSRVQRRSGASADVGPVVAQRIHYVSYV